MSAFPWSVSTPDGIVASGTCTFMVVPTTRGELGVMAGHAALVSCVAAGDLRVTSAEGAVTSIPVGPGIIEVRENTVRLLLSSVPHPVT